MSLKIVFNLFFGIKMLENLFFYLLITGICFAAPAVDKHKKIASFLFFCVFAALFAVFFEAFEAKTADTFSFSWIQLPKYRININIDSTPLAYLQLLPIYAISFVFALIAAFLPKEEGIRRFCSLTALNAAAMTALVCSNNLAQLLTCICMADIISVMLIKNIIPAKRYVFYCLFADIGLLMIFAMLQGKLRSFGLDTVISYNKLGRHKDFVAIATLLFIFVKSGFFMFQGALLDLKNIKNYKILFVISVSGVMSGIFALIKIYPLLQISSYSLPILNFMLAASAVWGFCGGIAVAGTNQKIVYFNMLFHSLIVYIFIQDGIYGEKISLLLISGFFTSLALTVHKKLPSIVVRAVLLALWAFASFDAYKNGKQMEAVIEGAICVFLLLAGYVKFFYRYAFLQKNTFFDRLYDILLVRPILILGRGLWVMVDFMIMERQIVGSVSAAGNITSSFVEKMRKSSWLVGLLFAAASLLIFAASFYLQEK